MPRGFVFPGLVSHVASTGAAKDDGTRRCRLASSHGTRSNPCPLDLGARSSRSVCPWKCRLG